MCQCVSVCVRVVGGAAEDTMHNTQYLSTTAIRKKKKKKKRRVDIVEVHTTVLDINGLIEHVLPGVGRMTHAAGDNHYTAIAHCIVMFPTGDRTFKMRFDRSCSTCVVP